MWSYIYGTPSKYINFDKFTNIICLNLYRSKTENNQIIEKKVLFDFKEKKFEKIITGLEDITKDVLVEDIVSCDITMRKSETSTVSYELKKCNQIIEFLEIMKFLGEFSDIDRKDPFQYEVEILFANSEIIFYCKKRERE